MDVVFKLKLAKRWVTKIFLIKEKNGIKVRIPLYEKIKYIFMGFTDFQYVIFDLKHNDHRNYISMWERYKLEYLDGEFAVLLGQKLLFYRTFNQYINIPKIYCWISGGRLIDPENGAKTVDICEIAKINDLIAKPNHSAGGGKGIFGITYRDGYYNIGDNRFNSTELLQYLSECEDYLIVKRISPHDYSKRIAPETANTIRVVTVMNDQHSDAEVLFAFHRFGTRQSAPVDNMSKGGLFSYIDLDTGMCGIGKQLHHIDQEFLFHPDTGERIEGMVVPEWNKLLNYLKQAHLQFPFYEFFAWDVLISEDRTPYIMEINRGSDLSIQVLHPMRNDKLGDYMYKHGLLDRRGRNKRPESSVTEYPVGGVKTQTRQDLGWNVQQRQGTKAVIVIGLIFDSAICATFEKVLRMSL